LALHAALKGPKTGPAKQVDPLSAESRGAVAKTRRSDGNELKDDTDNANANTIVNWGVTRCCSCRAIARPVATTPSTD